MHSNIFDRLSFWSLFLVLALLPIFCLPFTNIPIETSKGLLLVIGLAFCVIFWAIARFSDGRIIFPKSWLLLSGLGVALAFLLSALFSGSIQVSLFGTMFDIGSFWFIFAGFVLMLMSSIVFRTPQRAKIVLLGTILSSAFVLIFQGVHLFLPSPLSLGILAGKTGNILGSWNALGLFAGFSGLMFLWVIEFFPISKMGKTILQILILISVLLAAAVNFSLVWVLLGISSLIIFVYKVSITSHKNLEEGGKRYFPIISFTVVMIALLFFMSANFVGSFIPNRLQISNTEVNPSLGATLSVTKGVLAKNPVLGTGPNRFGEAWSMHKPAAINYTQFWDTSFNSGAGLLPTLTATTGGLGIFSLLIFFILFLFIGARSVFSSIKNKANWEMMAFFVLSLYLFVSSFFYSTGSVIFLLALAFAGVFIGLTPSISSNEVSISFLNDYRKSFFSILLLILLAVFSAALSFTFIERFASVFYFGRALSASTEPLAESSINKALSLYPNDLYLRTSAQIYLVKLNSIASKGATLSDADKTDLQASFNQAVGNAQMATAYDSSNYLNFQLLGSVYQAVGSLGVKDAYGKAVLAYQNASNLNPLNPGLKLAMAGASFVDGKVQDAKDYANQALSLKQDYVDALITLSQIAKSEGNMTSALSYAQNALSLSPNDKNLIQYVNSLNNPAPAPAPAPASAKPKK
jgi:tetratricopeptide (TPR) repeat protein